MREPPPPIPPPKKVKRLPLEEALAQGRVAYFDPDPAYLEQMARMIDVQPIKDAGLTAADIVHVNAHGTSTPQGDVTEAGSIRHGLGAAVDDCVVTSTKSMTGHLLGGAGGVESVYTVLSLHHQVCPPTINLQTPDPECDLDYCANAARDMRIDYALKNNFGFGGTNGSLLFKRV